MCVFIFAYADCWFSHIFSGNWENNSTCVYCYVSVLNISPFVDYVFCFIFRATISYLEHPVYGIGQVKKTPCHDFLEIIFFKLDIYIDLILLSFVSNINSNATWQMNL